MHAGASLEMPEGGAAAAPLASEWQLPSAVLNRFVLSAGAGRALGDAAAKTVRYGFRAAHIGLLLEEGVGAELVAQAAVAPIPSAPVWLSGLMNLRGNLVSIVDLKTVLGVGGDAEPAGKSQETVALVLVFGKGERAIGVLIDAAPQALRDLDPVAQMPPLPERLAPHTGSGHVEGRDFWVEFRHESFFESLAAEGGGI